MLSSIMLYIRGMYAHMLSHFSCVQFFVTAWTILAHEVPLSMDSPGKNSGVGCHLLLKGSFPDQGLNL